MNGDDISPDDLLDALIGRAVSGKPSPWPTSQNFEWKGSFEATYREGGDTRQILLWAIEDCAQRGTLVLFPTCGTHSLVDIDGAGV